MSFSLTQFCSQRLSDSILPSEAEVSHPTNQEKRSPTVYRMYCTSSNTHIFHVTSKTFVTHCCVCIQPKNQFYNYVDKFSSSTLISAQFMYAFFSSQLGCSLELTLRQEIFLFMASAYHKISQNKQEDTLRARFHVWPPKIRPSVRSLRKCPVITAFWDFLRVFKKCLLLNMILRIGTGHYYWHALWKFNGKMRQLISLEIRLYGLGDTA